MSYFQVKYMLPVLYCSLNCQERDYTNPRYPHREVCQARQQSQENFRILLTFWEAALLWPVFESKIKQPTGQSYEVESLRQQLNDERIRANDISRENSQLQKRIQNYQEELSKAEKEHTRLREDKRKVQSEVDRAKANTKVFFYVLEFYFYLGTVDKDPVWISLFFCVLIFL